MDDCGNRLHFTAVDGRPSFSILEAQMNYLTIQEVEKTLEVAMLKSARDHLMLLLSFRHGLRCSEVAKLKLESVRDGQIKVERLKGSMPTLQPLMPSDNDLFDEPMALERWLRLRPQGSEFLFPTRTGAITRIHVGRLAKHYLHVAGVREGLAHHHAFKHAFCSIQARNGVKIEYIAQSVGHRDIKNTRIYLNVSDSEAMEEAAKGLAVALATAPRNASPEAGA